MKIFNLFGRKEHQKTVNISGVGDFVLSNKGGEPSFKTEITSAGIGKDFVLNFPVNNDSITSYQIDYYKSVENNWDEIVHQLPQDRLKDSKVVEILIPDKDNGDYDISAEIVMKNNSRIYSVVLKNLIIEEVIDVD